MKIIVLTFIMRIEQLVTKTENSKDLICQNYLIYKMKTVLKEFLPHP
jgi:hypothetical protein